MKIGNFLYCCYIFILSEIFDKSLGETPLSTCPINKPFKVQDGCANFVDISIKREVITILLIIIIVINIILVFVLLLEIRFKLITNCLESKQKRNKIQIKELKEKIEELEGEIESGTEKIKSKDEKIKEIEIKCNNFETRVKELEMEINKFKKDKIELTETIDDKNKEIDKIVKAKDEDIKTKQQAIDNIKGKIEKYVFTIDELNANIAQHVGDLEECRSALKNEKEKYGNLNGISMDRQRKIEAYETKIKSLEDEIQSIQVAGFQNQFTPGIPKNPDNKLLGDAVLVACPNCATMYSPDEIEHHLIKCLECQ